MNRTAWLQERRMQKFQDVLGRWEKKKLSGLEAAETIGDVGAAVPTLPTSVTNRTGIGGLVDRRLGKASARRVAVSEIEWMLDQYRTHYRGLERDAFSRASAEAAQFPLGLYLGEDAAAGGGAGGSGARVAGRTGASGRASRAWA